VSVRTGGMRCQVGNEFVIGKASGLGKAVHALLDFNENSVTFNEILQVVGVDDVLVKQCDIWGGRFRRLGAGLPSSCFERNTSHLTHKFIPLCLLIRSKIDDNDSIESFILPVAWASLFSSCSKAVTQERINLARTLSYISFLAWTIHTDK
jgi:hypothetical protein